MQDSVAMPNLLLADVPTLASPINSDSQQVAFAMTTETGVGIDFVIGFEIELPVESFATN